LPIQLLKYNYEYSIDFKEVKMELLHHFISQSKDFFLELGPLGLFLLAFIESSVFIIPPDTLLILLVLSAPSTGLILALICTIGSTLGGILGYGIGYWGGRPILNRIISQEKLDKVSALYDRYGVWAVAIAGFSPLPYKVFTISSGMFKLNLIAFTIASFLSRGARFFLVAIFLMIFGKSILDNLQTIIIAGSVALVVGVVVYFIYRNKVRKSNATIN
jgi:undecaprenyl-diphosphatase